MKLPAAALVAAFLIVAPPLCGAQDRSGQDPYSYANEDDHPLKFISYLLAPIGFVFDWGVMRPMHYLSTTPPLKPVMTGNPDPYLDRPEIPARVPPLQPPASAAVAAAAPSSTGGLEEPNSTKAPSAVKKRVYKTAPPPPPEVYSSPSSPSSGGQSGNQPVIR